MQLLWFLFISITWYISVIFVMKLQKPSLQLVMFLCDTCCLSQSISTISCSLSDMCDAFVCLKFIYIQWDKFELCAMLLSNNLFLYIHDFLLVTMVSFLRLVYMCKFLCRWISLTICLLRNLYIWDRSLFSWYPNSFELPCFYL